MNKFQKFTIALLIIYLAIFLPLLVFGGLDCGLSSGSEDKDFLFGCSGILFKVWALIEVIGLIMLLASRVDIFKERKLIKWILSIYIIVAILYLYFIALYMFYDPFYQYIWRTYYEYRSGGALWSDYIGGN